jgi:hypothetical protein
MTRAVRRLVRETMPFRGQVGWIRHSFDLPFLLLDKQRCMLLDTARKVLVVDST